MCDACGKAFGMKQGLKEHYIIVHEKNGKLKCQHCQFTAPNNSRLRFHVQTVHEKKSTFTCQQCTFTCCKFISSLSKRQRKSSMGFGISRKSMVGFEGECVLYTFKTHHRFFGKAYPMGDFLCILLRLGVKLYVFMIT